MARTALLDPDNIEVVIHCYECWSPLWEMKILSRFGEEVGATETKPINQTVPPMGACGDDCPKCGRQFFRTKKDGDRLFLAWHAASRTMLNL